MKKNLVAVGIVWVVLLFSVMMAGMGGTTVAVAQPNNGSAGSCDAHDLRCANIAIAEGAVCDKLSVKAQRSCYTTQANNLVKCILQCKPIVQ